MALLLRPPGERESLPEQLSDLGRFRKRVAVATGVFALIAVIVGVATLAGFLDAAFHLPALVRALALVVLLAAAGVVWIRGIARSLALRTDSLSVALELEDQFATLNDSLASAVSFLEPVEGEQTSGPPGTSNRLQASAVRVAERKAGRLPLDRIVPTAHCWRAAWICFAVLAVSVPLILWNTPRVAIAAVRLADPFGTHPWPTKTQIEILSPSEFPARMAKGDPFELKFAVRGVISGPATVHIRMNGNESEEQFPLALNNDPELPGAAVVTARFDPSRVSNTFSVRITANDADTNWQTVTVVPPPRLVPLNGRPSPQFHITPPTYTGLPSVDLPDGASVIEIPIGTLVRLRAATDVRLSSAVLTYLGDKSALATTAPFAPLGHTNPLAAIGQQQLADALGNDIPLSLSSDRQQMSVEFVPSLTGSYALRFTDETGLTGTRFLEIRLITDPAPIVTLSRPQVGRDPPFLSPSATITLAATADDKKLYGARRVFLEYRVGRDGQLRTRPMVSVSRVSPNLLSSVGGGLAFGLPHEEPIAIERYIPVSEFRRDDGSPLRENDLLILRVAADDWDDVTVLKAPGRSAEIEIRIASPEAIEAWIQRELSLMRPDLIRLREQQREAKLKIAEIAPLPGGTLGPGDRDRLLGAEQTQRQIRAKITDTRDGLRAKADLLLATVIANNLPKSNTTYRVERVAEELGLMDKHDLGTIEQNLADARQLAGQPAKPGQEQDMRGFLKEAAKHQKKVEDTATLLIDLLAQWGGAGEIRGEARVLKDMILGQLIANEQLRKLVPEGKLNPSDDEQRELDRAGVRAEEAARRANELIDRAGRLATEKDNQAGELRTQAALKEKEAADLRAKAANATNPKEKFDLIEKADAAAAEAADLRAIANKAEAEAKALRAAIEAAGGQELPDELRKAADAFRKNRQTAGETFLRNAISRLDKLADALKEQEPDSAPDLAKPKRWKNAADQLDALAGAQDDLRKRVADAQRIPDPEKRQAALRELAKEQDRLIERGRELLQKLTRDKADDPARDVRNAIEKMETARDDLDKGQPATRPQMEAVERLDIARDKLDLAAAQGGRQLSDEKRRKLADQVKALLERQRAAVVETTRIHDAVGKQMGWDKPLLTSYSDIEDREKNLAIELRKLAQNEFASLLVLARLLADAAGGMDSAGEKVKLRCDDADLAAAFDPELEVSNDRKVMRPMLLALRRLEQLHDALKPDDPKSANKNGNNPQNPPKGTPPQPNPNGGGDQDIIPPLAQLKVLRTLQAELNELTAKFAKEHPNPDKLTDEEKEELKELEQAQREITELFEQMAKLFEKKELPPDEGKKTPEEEKKEK